MQYRQHRTSNTNRAELIENALMVDPIKFCTEINLHDPSLLPTLQWTFQCKGRAQNFFTDTFPISKLGGWKHTTGLNILSKTYRHQALNPLNNTDVMEIGRWLATEEDGEPFWIGVTLACLQQAGKLPRRTSRRNTTLRREARTLAVFLRKWGKIPMGQCHHNKGPSITRDA